MEHYWCNNCHKIHENLDTEEVTIIGEDGEYLPGRMCPNCNKPCELVS